MIKGLFIIFMTVMSFPISAQHLDSDLLHIKERLDSVSSFSAKLELDLEVPFINMPTKNATIKYQKGKDLIFSSTDFVMLPKRGLDFSLTEIFKYAFITVDRGMDTKNGLAVKVLNIIPDDERSSLAMATLYLDTKNKRLVASNMITKKDGSFELEMEYGDLKDIFPSDVIVEFAVEKLSIPLNFMGSDTEIDRKQMRKSDTKTGKILMAFDDYEIIKEK
tara:strand:+ start:41183 stop:41842 length:660 start_codon:yes stop_codon:yes gene_type:complete